MLAGRGNGPHPYELGADSVQRYFQVMQGCARAAQLKLEQKVVGRQCRRDIPQRAQRLSGEEINKLLTH